MIDLSFSTVSHVKRTFFFADRRGGMSISVELGDTA